MEAERNIFISPPHPYSTACTAATLPQHGPHPRDRWSHPRRTGGAAAPPHDPQRRRSDRRRRRRRSTPTPHYHRPAAAPPSQPRRTHSCDRTVRTHAAPQPHRRRTLVARSVPPPRPLHTTAARSAPTPHRRRSADTRSTPTLHPRRRGTVRTGTPAAPPHAGLTVRLSPRDGGLRCQSEPPARHMRGVGRPAGGIARQWASHRDSASIDRPSCPYLSVIKRSSKKSVSGEARRTVSNTPPQNHY